MRESFTYGSVGRAPGNRCLYPELDGVLLRSTPQVKAKELLDEPLLLEKGNEVILTVKGLVSQSHSYTSMAHQGEVRNARQKT